MNRRMKLKVARLPMFRARIKYDRMFVGFVRSVGRAMTECRTEMFDVLASRFRAP